MEKSNMKIVMFAVNKLTQDQYDKILESANKKKISESQIIQQLEIGSCLLAIAGIEDEPKPKIKETIQQFEEAGIQTIIVTGDSLQSTSMFARKIGLIDDYETVKPAEEWRAKINDSSESEDNYQIDAVHSQLCIEGKDLVKTIKQFDKKIQTSKENKSKIVRNMWGSIVQDTNQMQALKEEQQKYLGFMNSLRVVANCSPKQRFTLA